MIGYYLQSISDSIMILLYKFMFGHNQPNLEQSKNGSKLGPMMQPEMPLSLGLPAPSFQLTQGLFTTWA